MRQQKIEDNGGLEAHYDRLGLKWDIFVLMAEANWNPQQKQYNGISSMARVLGLSEVTMAKHLAIYDKEIGRHRGKHKDQRQQLDGENRSNGW